ncbi:MAG: putative dsRNA-binding protein, partial [Sweet potato little leaf phytoplasma]|nr:putative dsRNA-binding protein [Sweet potato little leaf phytoplasma]
VAETGLAHEKEFIAEVYLSEQLLGKGEGKTKKSAEQQALTFEFGWFGLFLFWFIFGFPCFDFVFSELLV